MPQDLTDPNRHPPDDGRDRDGDRPGPAETQRRRDTAEAGLMALDGVGSYLEDLNQAYAAMSQRTLGMWGLLRERLTQDRYTVDEMAADTLQAWFTGLANMGDLISLGTRNQARTRTAGALPTAVVTLERPAVDGSYGIVDPVSVSVDIRLSDNPPAQADIVLSGQHAPTAKKLAAVLRAPRVGRRVTVETIDVPDDGPPQLATGLYVGLLSLEAQPIALLAVLVTDLSAN